MLLYAALLRALPKAAQVAVVLLLCGLLLVPAAARFMSNGGGDSPQAITQGADGYRMHFSLKGTAKGLWPGRRKSLRVRIVNRNAFAIRVLSLSVRAQRSDKRGCTARWIKARKTKRFSLKVAPRTGEVASYPIRLAKRAPNSCQGARWPLRFRGTAKRVR